jgi:hypothetical protein
MAKKVEKEVEKEEPKQTQPAIVLTETEKIDFFKCFISDSPYEGEDTLLNGAMVLKFRALTSKQTLGVYNLIKEEQNSGALTNDINYFSKVTVYRLVQSLQSINQVPFAPDKDTREKAGLVNDWPGFKLAAVCESFKNFEDKIIELTKEVKNENFWKAVKVSS